MAQQLSLTRKQRAALFDGEFPRITGDGKCPVGAGYVLTLSKHVTLCVLEVRIRRGGGWSLHYEVRDCRDPVRLLRHTPPASATAPSPPASSDVVEAAAEESAYTSSYTPLADAGEAIDAVTMRRYAKEAEVKDTAREAKRRKQHEMKALSNRLAALEAETGVDLSRQMAGVRRRIVAMESKTRQRTGR